MGVAVKKGSFVKLSEERGGEGGGGGSKGGEERKENWTKKEKRVRDKSSRRGKGRHQKRRTQGDVITGTGRPNYWNDQEVEESEESESGESRRNNELENLKDSVVQLNSHNELEIKYRLERVSCESGQGGGGGGGGATNKPSSSKVANKSQIRRHLRCQGAFRNTRCWQMGRTEDNPRDSTRQAERDKRRTRSTCGRWRSKKGQRRRRRRRRRRRGSNSATTTFEDEVTDEEREEKEEEEEKHGVAVTVGGVGRRGAPPLGAVIAERKRATELEKEDWKADSRPLVMGHCHSSKRRDKENDEHPREPMDYSPFPSESFHHTNRGGDMLEVPRTERSFLSVYDNRLYSHPISHIDSRITYDSISENSERGTNRDSETLNISSSTYLMNTTPGLEGSRDDSNGDDDGNCDIDSKTDRHNSLWYGEPSKVNSSSLESPFLDNRNESYASSSSIPRQPSFPVIARLSDGTGVNNGDVSSPTSPSSSSSSSSSSPSSPSPPSSSCQTEVARRDLFAFSSPLGPQEQMAHTGGHNFVDWSHGRCGSRKPDATQMTPSWKPTGFLPGVMMARIPLVAFPPASIKDSRGSHVETPVSNALGDLMTFRTTSGMARDDATPFQTPFDTAEAQEMPTDLTHDGMTCSQRQVGINERELPSGELPEMSPVTNLLHCERCEEESLSTDVRCVGKSDELAPSRTVAALPVFSQTPVNVVSETTPGSLLPVERRGSRASLSSHSLASLVKNGGRRGSSHSSTCLEGSVVSSPLRSEDNEKLPYERPIRASSNPGWSLSFALMVLVILLPQTFALPAVIRIGAIFTEDQRDSATELAFKYAVYRINNDKIILPNTTLIFDIQYAPRDDSFHTAKKACKQITFGVQAIFGPFEPLLGSHIQSITDALDIPHLEARLDMEPQEKEFSINLYPSHQFLNQAYKDMIQFLKWKKVAIVYEEDFGLMKLQEIIRSPPSKSIEIYIRQGHPENYRDILKEVKHKEIYSIIVDTLPQNMNLFLRCLLQLQMNDYRYHYLFTTFDIETFDLEDFKYNFVNMTAFRLVDTGNAHVRRTLRDMEKFQPIGHTILNKSTVIQAEPALIYDSVNVFAKGLHALERSATLSLANLSCESETPWPDGSSLFNYINAVEYDGVTGPIKFTEGKRSNFKLDILKLRMEKLYKVGEWTPESQINITDHQAFFEGGKPNITLKVITIEEKPYVMLRKGQNFTGNHRFYGFCIDLLERLAGMTGFDYEIEVQPNARYGTYNVTTGEWDGLVRIISHKKADLAVGSMTINYARESVIDFTKPFMNLGVSILFKIPTSQPTRLFSFMNPLAVEIWLYVLAAYMLVSFTMFVMARFSPYEWNNPHPCNNESDVVENQFTLNNSFWFITGTLLRQGSGLNPKAASTRIVGGIWWFFTLIIISSYTANLAAFLTVERMITPIESAEDLAEQNEIEYGTLEGGSTMAFFRDSKIETYQKMWRYMESKRPSVFVPTIEEGVQRVLQGNYAFLMESTMLDYTIQRNCNLTQVGGLLNSNSYGIATPIGSPWRDKISLAILELQEKGIIQMLYSKWWKNTGDVCNRDEKNKDSKANALGVENIGGVFVVLLCGLALAIVVAILEFCWNSRKNAQTDRYPDDEDDESEDGEDEEPEYDEFGEKIERPKTPRPPPRHQSLCSEMAEELRFAMKCQGSRQRPALKRNCSRCTPGTTYVPAANDLPQANGENGLLPMIEFRKSSVVQFDADSPS